MEGKETKNRSKQTLPLHLVDRKKATDFDCHNGPFLYDSMGELPGTSCCGDVIWREFELNLGSGLCRMALAALDQRGRWGGQSCASIRVLGDWVKMFPQIAIGFFYVMA